MSVRPCGYEPMTTTITSSGPACVMIVAGQQQQQLYMPSSMNHRPPQPNPLAAPAPSALATSAPSPCSPIVFFLVRLHYRPTAACSHFATTAAGLLRVGERAWFTSELHHKPSRARQPFCLFCLLTASSVLPLLGGLAGWAS